MTFDIEWALEDEDWDEAASVSRRKKVGSEYDVSMYACDELLPARLWFRTDTPSLEPFDHAAVVSKWFFAPNNIKLDLHETEFAQGFSLRLLDFAVQLQQFLDDREIIDSELAYRDFQDSMGPLRIRFHKSAGHLFIYSSFSPGWRLRLAAGDFASGSYTFVSRFTAEVAQRAPLLLTWTSMSGLAKLA